MDVTVKKSQFVDDGSGNLVVHGHVRLTDDNGKEQPYKKETLNFTSDNGNVARISGDSDNPEKFTVSFVGDGTCLLQATANASVNPGEADKFLTASINLTVEEDEDTKMEMVLDL